MKPSFSLNAARLEMNEAASKSHVMIRNFYPKYNFYKFRVTSLLKEKSHVLQNSSGQLD